MTYFNHSHWSLVDGKYGLLVFAQAFEELLAPHSHDSYKVPALNFHFICFEIEQVISLVEDNVLDKGNIRPLFSEMKSLFSQDPIALKMFGNDFDAMFARKNDQGEFNKKPIKIETEKITDDAISLLKSTIHFLIAEMNRNSQYYKGLLSEIKERICHCGSDLSQLDSIYSLVRIMASELINRGFSQTYIYDCIKRSFFDPSHEVDSITVVEDFFHYFSTTKREFSLYFPLNSIKQKNALEDYSAFTFADNIYEMFDSSIPYILKYDCKASDPYAAREQALKIANFCLSVNQFIKHNKYDYNPKYAEVVDTTTHEVTFIKKPEAPIARGYTNCNIVEVKELLNTCFGLDSGVLQVLQLHSAALISKNIDNQLINLWTAIEVAVPVARKGGLSRINQICNTLTAALSHDYFHILVQQLLIDINEVSAEVISKIQSVSHEGGNDAKLVVILTLPKYCDLYTEIIGILIEKAPLLTCRMNHYKNQWSDTAKIRNAYQMHAKRLAQQIMRIYRTRNMLVHDGTSLPYMEYVLQNLHYYIDSYISCLNNYHKMGYKSVQSIADAVQFQEQRYLQALLSKEQLSEDNVVKYIC